MIIIINSIYTLKQMLSSEGVEKLGLFLEKGEIRYNLIFIIAEQSINLSGGLTFEKWYKRHINSGDGIWVGSGISEQYELKPAKITSEMRDELTSNFGFALHRGKSVMVKLLNSENEEDDYDVE